MPLHLEALGLEVTAGSEFCGFWMERDEVGIRSWLAGPPRVQIKAIEFFLGGRRRKYSGQWYLALPFLGFLCKGTGRGGPFG